MANKIEVTSKIPDTRAEVRRKKLASRGFNVDEVHITDAYTVDTDLEDLEGLASLLVSPVVQEVTINRSVAPEKFDYALEVGFLPGVTDNVGTTAREVAEDLVGRKIEGQGVYSSQIIFLSGKLSRNDAVAIGAGLSNPIIQRVSVKSYEEFIKDNGMGVIVPRVKLNETPRVDLVGLLDASSDSLATIGKQGIANKDGTRRGPLAMRPSYMKAAQDYAKARGSDLTDIELETVAQSWSEHCCHTIFADPIDEITEGLYKAHIKAATNEIRKRKGKDDFCVSVFKDNSGAIIFDDQWLITDKVETHNSPSALDPFGGSITGIVGVDRDAMGFGMGAKPFSHRYGFCVANPFAKRITIPKNLGSDVDIAADKIEGDLFRDKKLTQKMLSARHILDGVIDGVNVGGNCSGIPTDLGFLYVEDRFRGKPLVWVGVEGLIPRQVNGRDMCEKQAQPGDYIVMAGGRVGKDGIHGATFSSESLNTGSPATAVQIGDPITQKKMSDALVKEARDLGLYRSITDNGAGGLSCSVREMAKESNGCVVKLENVPLKYPGLEPWETWVSESQERMTLAVPPEKWEAFNALMKRRGVEATVIGEFTDSGNCVVNYNGEKVVDLKMDFLESGMPVETMKTTFTKRVHEEPQFQDLEDATEQLYAMLGRLNVASYEFISQQYDHEVQGGSVLKPLQGAGKVNASAVAVKPVLSSQKAVVKSQGINPSYSDIDTYHMAACAIDTAVRAAVAAGAKLDRIALLDNFCWCSSNDPERLGQLRRATQACYDTAVAYETPFISGKDSMFNDFRGFDEKGSPVNISIPPTLLVSSIAVADDATKTVSLDAKLAGDLVYVLGETKDEMGGSEYYAMVGEKERRRAYIGNNVPQVDSTRNRGLYERLGQAIDQGLVASSQSVERAGLAVALAKTAMGGRLGMHVDLTEVRGDKRRDATLFSESQGRIVVTIDPNDRERFEQTMAGSYFAKIGYVRGDSSFIISDSDGDRILVKSDVNKMLQPYRATYKDL